MKAIIMGCGRVGAQLAAMLDTESYDVVVLDIDPHSFRRLPQSFKGTPVVGNGTDEDVLRHAGIEEAQIFVAVTQGDNRNVLAAQIAKHIFKVPRVVCRIYDPIREQMYRSLGLQTISPTIAGAQMLRKALEA